MSLTCKTQQRAASSTVRQRPVRSSFAKVGNVVAAPPVPAQRHSPRSDTSPNVSGAEEYGGSTAPLPLSTRPNPPKSLVNTAVARWHRASRISVVPLLTCRGSPAYIPPIRHAGRPGATARLRSSSLIFGEKAPGLGRKPQTSTALWFTRGRDLHGPGLFDR